MMIRYFLATTALLAALYIYLFYRTDLTIINQIATQVIDYQQYRHIKSFIAHTTPLPPWAIFNLPGGLWVFAATLMAPPGVWSITPMRMAFFTMPILYAVGIEIIQLLHLTRGRFDLLDITLSVIGFISARYICKNKESITGEKDRFWQEIVFLLCFAVVYMGYAPQ